MRRRWIFLLIAFTSGAALWVIAGSPARPLVYEGKPLDQWLDAGYEDAARVLYEVGPPAIEAIFTKLKREHPRYGTWGRYRWAWSKCPGFCQTLLPAPQNSGFDEWRACNALLAIGPQAIPSLCQSLKDRHFLVRSVSAETLGLLRKRGANIRRALPGLEAALHDGDAGVRQQAAGALGVETAARPSRVQ